MSSVASWESLSGWDVFERQRWQGDTRWPHVMRTCSKSEKLLYCDLESCGKPCLVFPWLRTSFSRSPQPELSRGSVSNTKDLQCRMSTVACCQRGKAAQLNKGAGQRAMTTSHPSGSRLQDTARDCKRLQDQMGTLLHIPIPWSILHRFAARFLGMGFAAGACPSGMSGIHIRNYHDMDQIVLRCQTFVGITVWILQEAALLGVVCASWACSLQRSGRDKWHKCTAPVWLLLDR